MMRTITHLCFAILLSLIETSFFASTHGLFRFTPFVLVVSVYVLQHHSLRAAGIWMIVHGLLLDLAFSSLFPWFTLAYALTAFVAKWSAQHLFSNRSFYGVLACMCVSSLFFETLLLFGSVISIWFGNRIISWSTLFLDATFRSVTMLVFLVLLFTFAKQIRLLLVRLFLLPATKQTY